MADKFWESSHGRLWIQPDGPNTPLYYFDCAAIGDVSQSRSAATIIRRLSRDRHGQYDIVASVPGVLEPGSATITGPEPKSRGEAYLEKIRDSGCPFGAQIRFAGCKNPDSRLAWRNGGKIRFLHNLTLGDWSSTGSMDLDGASPSLASQTAGPSFEKMFEIYAPRLGVDQVTASALAVVTALAVWGEGSCGDECGVARQPCQYAVAGTSNIVAAQELAYSRDGMVTWATMPAGWTVATDNIVAAAGRGDIAFVVNGTSNAEIARLEFGATGAPNWVNITLPTLAQVAADVSMPDSNHIWVVGAAGAIWHSDDGGQSWAVQGAGVTAANLSCVHFVNSRIGMAAGAGGVALLTTNGGQTWATIATGVGGANTINGCHVIDEHRMWVAADNEVPRYTKDGWATNAAITRYPSGWVATDDPQDIVFDPTGNVGWLGITTNAGAGWFWQTVDGGYTWDCVDTPASAATRWVKMCDGDANLMAATLTTATVGTIVKVL